MWTRPQDNSLQKTPFCQNLLPVCHYCVIFHSLCQNVIKSSSHKFWNNSMMFFIFKIPFATSKVTEKVVCYNRKQCCTLKSPDEWLWCLCCSWRLFEEALFGSWKKQQEYKQPPPKHWLLSVGWEDLHFLSRPLFMEKRHACRVSTKPKFIHKVQHLAVTKIVQGLLFFSLSSTGLGYFSSLFPLMLMRRVIIFHSYCPQ